VAIVTVELDDEEAPRADPGDLVQLTAAARPPASDPIDVDDVLDMHGFLERFEGGTVALLERLEDGSTA
jgi:hypothetical protein